MKLNKDIDVTTDDFWYDLIEGGYIKPKELCVYEQDVDAIWSAISVLEDFKRACEETYEDFYSNE